MDTTMKSPYLSIVMIGRNDNYGGDFKQRLQNCLHWTHRQLTSHKITSELIFVNYNPLPLPAIEDFLDWPLSNQFVTVRILTVPSEAHLDFVTTYGVKNVPVLEYVAKNAGIRRSNGQFILCMNPDILIDDRIFGRLLHLSEYHYYRCNRCDFDCEVNLAATSNLWTAIEDRVTRIWYKGNFVKVNGMSRLSYAFHWVSQTIDNLWKANTERLQWILNPFRINVYYHNVEFMYHCNAAGDFMLVSRAHWWALKGFRENAHISLHTDSMFVIQAAASGIKEKTFPYPVFHKEHERRYDALKNDPEQRKVYLDYQHRAKRMVIAGRPEIFNGDDWGLGKMEIPETLIF
jgi:hypothetical protein